MGKRKGKRKRNRNRNRNRKRKRKIKRKRKSKRKRKRKRKTTRLGCHGVMNEKLEAKGMPIFAWLQSLFQVAVVQDRVNVVFQVTRRCLLWKGKAEQTRCGNHRGMHASSAILSVMLDVIKRRMDEQIQNFLLHVPCGQQGGGTSFAMLFAQAFVQYTVGTSTNTCTVFADLENAYDMIPRELTTCCQRPESVLAEKRDSFGLKNTDLGWCLDVLRRVCPVLCRNGHRTG